MRTLLAIARLGSSLKSISVSLTRLVALYELELDARFNVRLIDPSKLSSKERETEIMYGPSKPDNRVRESEWDDDEETIA